MATFYVGPRPVLRGRNTNDMVNPWKGTSGTYSFYPLFAKGVLDGGPDNHHVPGTGYHPGNVFLSQIFNGSTLYIHPLSGTFADGAGYEGARFKPMEYKGVSGVFSSGYGHGSDKTRPYSLYSNYIFDGVAAANAFASGYGHAKRTNDYSLYNNYIFDGVNSANVFPSGYGQANTSSEYGRNKVKEWAGVASARAL
jgi:GH24 family phage-related lysozyme (muramidase)